MIDLIDDSGARDPFPIPFEWNSDLFSFTTEGPMPDEAIWYPQIDGTWIACPGRGEG